VKIIYIHQYFKTFTEGGSSRSYYLAKALVANGFEVEMITSHNSRDYVCAVIDGIRVHYLPVYYDNQLGFLGRIRAFIAFMWQAYRLAARLKNANLCYASSTPLTVGITALLLKKIKGIPYYFEVRDLWPLAPAQLGIIRNRWLKKLLFRAEQTIYQEAATIVALSPGIASYIRERNPGKPVYILPNISDCVFFRKEHKNPQLAHKYQVGGKFVITYFGAIGKVNYLQSLIEIARKAQQDHCHELAFMVVGRGNELRQIQAAAHKYNLKNLQFIPHLSKYQLREVLNVTDAVYVSFAPYPVLETSSPNKFFDALATGKLCITNTRGWIAELVQENECGFYADPQKPDDFLAKVSYYLADPEALEQAQYNARQLAETSFSRHLLINRFLKIFETKVPAPAIMTALHN